MTTEIGNKKEAVDGLMEQLSEKVRNMEELQDKLKEAMHVGEEYTILQKKYEELQS